MVFIVVFGLVAAVGTRAATPAAKPDNAPPLKPAAVALRVKAMPFTAVDFVLLLGGGAMLLAAGSSIRRVRAERVETPKR